MIKIKIAQNGTVNQLSINGGDPNETTPKLLHKAALILEDSHRDIMHLLGNQILKKAEEQNIDPDDAEALSKFAYALTE